MKNPWTKKNPYLSMWLSGANAIGGTARARINSEIQRQMSTAYADMTRQVTDFWTQALTGAPAPKKRKRKPKSLSKKHPRKQ